ncbi:MULTISPECIES: outer membrane protein assembly factor BamD [unclassified Shewanella]|uniref:outer membrane protein assembly factor BamD n=1 Tax=unclassified Shewanella TaxID=196818 RepID=UPI000C81637F|nr:MULTISPECIES: outer membrane protein assembly factor BamD [unclassified Shewanella]MDO6617875.1 outer membrane protein assembly factor BamD [Shewanella sp. 6_MG-2023]MDO6639999.1 outer membrane protein assembly factor BamD [Shewanella sp. 5_MG-2023]MDO6678345.1 outer membrane protein assembly factor BamD [Shewanella sp. 4_MG-2023]MDO6775530.1 outer membrane protein assembly factor BamD [Shewanella sp. 3_MG-2023]PMG28186.1 membrane biogenesis protein [Shewanella sp. 10N.286.52.C2]
MHNFAKGAALVLFSLTLTACSTSKGFEEEVVSNKSPEALYAQARTSMELGNYSKAVRTLEALDSRYPFGPHKTQVQLDMIFAYYKMDDVASGIANIDRFLRLNPTHPDIDYVYYMRGLTNMQADNYLFHDMMNIDRTDRDPKNAQDAFKDFDRLIKSYPDSKYAADAQHRMQYLKNRLAKYSIKVAEYYIKMGAWSAAAVRAQTVMEQFPGTPSTEHALEIMAQAYEELGQEQLKQNVVTVMAANFPNNELVSN